MSIFEEREIAKGLIRVLQEQYATLRAQAKADRAELAEMRVAMARMTPVVEAALAVVDIGFAGEAEWHDLVTAVAAYRDATPAPKPPRFTAAEAAELLAVADVVEVLGLERWDDMVAECKEVAK